MLKYSVRCGGFNAYARLVVAREIIETTLGSEHLDMLVS